MIELLGCVLIITFLCIEAYCMRRLYEIVCERSADKDPARRAATRPRIYKEVHDSWTIDRNRRNLWETIYK